VCAILRRRREGSSLGALVANLALTGKSAARLGKRGRQLLSESLNLAKQCAGDIRTLSYLLHPPLLDEAGLSSALRWYADGFAERSGLKVRVDLPAEFGAPERLPGNLETALFRVVQDPKMAQRLQTVLQDQRETLCSRTCREAQALLSKDRKPETIFSGASLADGTWRDVLNIARAVRPTAAVVVTLAWDDLGLYLEIMEQGAFDYIVPPFEAEGVAHIVRCAVQDVARRKVAALWAGAAAEAQCERKPATSSRKNLA